MPKGVYIRTKPAWNKDKKWLERRGKNNPMYNKHHSKKAKKAIRKSMIEQWANGKRKGYLRSVETREKIRKGNKNTKKSKEWKQKMKKWRNSPEGRKAMEKARQGGIKGLLILSKLLETKPEKEMRLKLDSWRINHISKFLMYNKFVVDEWLPNHNIVIEVDGRYWHTREKQIKKDKAKDAYLTKCGHKVIRVWEDKISNFSITYLN